MTFAVLAHLFSTLLDCLHVLGRSDRDENSAVNHYQRFFARLGPHASSEARCVAGDGAV